MAVSNITRHIGHIGARPWQSTLILTDLPDSFMTIIILAGSTDGLTRDLLEELADSFDLSKLTPIVLPESLYIPSP